MDARIAKTYAAATDATNKNSRYDSYLKAFRWSTDRLDPKHVRFPSKDDKSKILFNSQIGIENIPTQAYEYQVNDYRHYKSKPSK